MAQEPILVELVVLPQNLDIHLYHFIQTYGNPGGKCLAAGYAAGGNGGGASAVGGDASRGDVGGDLSGTSGSSGGQGGGGAPFVNFGSPIIGPALASPTTPKVGARGFYAGGGGGGNNTNISTIANFKEVVGKVVVDRVLMIITRMDLPQILMVVEEEEMKQNLQEQVLVLDIKV